MLLFFLQRRGIADIGRLLGPVMVFWFISIGVLRVMAIVGNPHVLSAVNPVRACRFFAANSFHGLVVLGSVVLCITGGEALYADLGHFGHRAIRLSWLCIAFPCLLLNYFGQGALLVANPEATINPFYGLVPRPLLYPMVGLATTATVIASQSMISGVYSLTQQAVQLGFLPRMQIVHTSSETQGQIYIPQVNWAMMVACLSVVLAFGNSNRLAGAYGIAVSATMGISSVLYFCVVTRRWGWSSWKALPLLMIFLVFDMAFFGANLLKLVDGGWFTILIASVVTLLMATWRDGRAAISRRMVESRLPVEVFLDDVARHVPQRVYGTSVYLTVSPVGTPPALLHFYKHAHVLHERVMLLSIQSADVPTVPTEERLQLKDLGQGFYRLIASYGFMERPKVPEIMKIASGMGLEMDPATTTYFLGRETLLTTGTSEMFLWRKKLFALMSRNAQTAMSYFSIPINRVVELGVQVEV